MTDVLVRLTVPVSGALASGWVPADEAPAAGHLDCRPYAPAGARRHEESPDRLVLPASCVVPLVVGEATLRLAPTESWWCWQIIERTPRGVTRYVVVPDLPTVVDYADLVDVDPTTLAATAEPEAAWWAAWRAMASGTYLVPDPANPGLYLPTAGSAMTEDPANDGLYTIGTLA